MASMTKTAADTGPAGLPPDTHVHSQWSWGAGFDAISGRFRDQAPDQVLRGYLTETAALISQFDAFGVLAHIDYPLRF